MNRVIKFRAWDEIGKEHVGYDLFNSKNSTTNLEIQEWTGLKDITGKDIYEGDLVDFYTPQIDHGPEREDFKDEEVWYSEDAAGFLFGKFYYDGWHGFHPYELKDIKVVGNIMKKPEKIKKL